MTTAKSPMWKLRSQADNMAKMLKAAERGEPVANDPAGKIAAARQRDSIEANARVMAASPELLAFAVQIAGFSPPGRDALDDAETLQSLIGSAQKLCAMAGLTVHPWDPAEDEKNEWSDA